MLSCFEFSGLLAEIPDTIVLSRHFSLPKIFGASESFFFVSISQLHNSLHLFLSRLVQPSSRLRFSADYALFV